MIYTGIVQHGSTIRIVDAPIVVHMDHDHTYGTLVQLIQPHPGVWVITNTVPEAYRYDPGSERDLDDGTTKYYHHFSRYPSKELVSLEIKRRDTSDYRPYPADVITMAEHLLNNHFTPEQVKELLDDA